MMRALRWVGLLLLVLGLPGAITLDGQAGPVQEETRPPADPLGRGTPRGTVVGFLSASRRGETLLARQYLNTTADPAAADILAAQLFTVLDARLPARLTAISDAEQGSQRNPLTPQQDLVATIPTASGTLDVMVERVDRSGSPIWLFSRKTLEAIPPVFEEVSKRRESAPRSRLLKGTPFGDSWIGDWLVVLAGGIAFYFLMVLLNRLVTPLAGRVWQRLAGRKPEWRGGAVPLPARLLAIALVSHWIVSALALSLVVRQFWSTAASLIVIASIGWLLILANAQVEAYLKVRLARATAPAAESLLRLVRRGVDALIVVFALLAILRVFAVDPTPALAGLGVGGIAVALAAQKTLENIVAGASLIVDQAVQVGDFLKMGEFTGTVDHIGLRSTRLRTMDRTIVSIPNSQIANANLETLSARDKFWFRHVVGLRYETTTEELRAVLKSLRDLLKRDRCVDATSVRVRFFRLGAFSMDVEVFAYVLAADWSQFLELQEDLLLAVTETIRQAGVQIAFPSQTMYVEGPRS